MLLHHTKMERKMDFLCLNFSLNWCEFANFPQLLSLLETMNKSNMKTVSAKEIHIENWCACYSESSVSWSRFNSREIELWTEKRLTVTNSEVSSTAMDFFYETIIHTHTQRSQTTISPFYLTRRILDKEKEKEKKNK